MIGFIVAEAHKLVALRGRLGLGQACEACEEWVVIMLATLAAIAFKDPKGVLGWTMSGRSEGGPPSFSTTKVFFCIFFLKGMSRTCWSAS